MKQGQIVVGLVSSGKMFGLGGNGEPLRVSSRGRSWLGVHLRKIILYLVKNECEKEKPDRQVSYSARWESRQHMPMV